MDTNSTHIPGDQQILIDLATTKMPFGKYAGRYLVDLPETYVLWFQQKGFPGGRLGELFHTLMVVKENGLEPMIRELRKANPSFIKPIDQPQ